MNKLLQLLPRVFLGCCVAGLLRFAIYAWMGPFAPDFTVFWAAARLVEADPSRLYDGLTVTVAQMWVIDLHNGMRPWAYPPTALLPFLPVAGLTMPLAFAVFTAASVAAFLAAAKSIIGADWKLGLVLVALSDAFIFGALNGQTTFLIGALIFAGLAALPNRAWLGGALLGIAAAIKPQLLILAPLALLALREWRGLVAFGLGGLSVVIASLALGPSLWADWLRSIPLFLQTVERVGILDRNITPSGIVWHLGLSGTLRTMVSISFAALAAFWVWRAFRSTDDLPSRLAALIGGGLWCSPYAMNYEIALLAPAAAAFLIRGARRESPLLLMLFGGLLLVATGPMTPAITLAFSLTCMVSVTGVPAALVRVANRRGIGNGETDFGPDFAGPGDLVRGDNLCRANRLDRAA